MTGLHVRRHGHHAKPSGPPCARHCEMCSEVLTHQHPHLVGAEPDTHICVCPGCHRAQASPSLPMDPLPTRGRCVYFASLRLVTEEDDFSLPFGLTIMFRTLVEDRLVAWYPMARGPTEVSLPPEAWPQISTANPGLGAWEPIDEAMLVRRSGPGPGQFAALLMPGGPGLDLIQSIHRRRPDALSHQQAKIALEDLWTSTTASASGDALADRRA